MLRAAACVAGCCWFAACSAARPEVSVLPAPPAAARIEAADHLVDEGCYTCLLEAFTAYETAGASGKAFSTALLLALREKELGLEATPWIDRARALASPATVPYLDMVSSVAWATVSSAPDFEPPARTPPALLQEWLALLQANPGPPVLDRYLLLALLCGRAAATAPDDPSFADRPLLQYRLGLCGFQQREHLDTVFAASPRFAETGFYLARYEMTNDTGRRVLVTRALPLLIAAHEGVPASPIITTTLATVWSGRNEFARALALYDEALAIRPSQRDALLGRARMLTYLGRSDDAIATATRMIDLGTWYLGDAYYWRAWNRYATGNIEGAADDVVDARRYQSSGELLTLSGMIAYDQQRPADARRDFDDALRVNPLNCPAMWYLGLIDVDARHWLPARGAFVEAAGCYTSAVAAIEAEELPADLSPEATQQQQEDRARTLADNQRQVARSALNAALLSMQIGDRETALRFAGIAGGHELTRERAEAILRER